MSDLTVSAILDERKMQSIAETAVNNAIAQLKDRYEIFIRIILLLIWKESGKLNKRHY